MHRALRAFVVALFAGSALACMGSGGKNSAQSAESASQLDTASSTNAATSSTNPSGGTEPNATAASGGAVATTITDTTCPWALVGRFDVSDPNHPRVNWPGAKIGVRFTGTSLAVRLVDTGSDSFDVNIDGNDYIAPGASAWWNDAVSSPNVPCVLAGAQLALSSNEFPGCVLATASANTLVPTTYAIASGLPAGEHTAWLTKRTEFSSTNDGDIVLYGFVLDRGAQLLTPPAYQARRLEFVGDSSTTGWGAAQLYPAANAARNADGGRSVPSYTAEYLKAEAVNLSCSGQGVNTTPVQPGQPNDRLPFVYQQTLGYRMDLPYDFSRDHVDAVVLLAGGDDLYGDDGNGYFQNDPTTITTPARDVFKDKFIAWLQQIRLVRPDALVVVGLTEGAYSNDIVTLGSALQEIVAARNTAGDANVVYYTFFPANDPVRNPNNFTSFYDAMAALDLTKGVAGHPTPMGAHYLGGLLGAFLAERLGWTDAGYTTSQ